MSTPTPAKKAEDEMLQEQQEKIDKGTSPKVPPKAEGRSTERPEMPQRFFTGGATAEEIADWKKENNWTDPEEPARGTRAKGAKDDEPDEPSKPDKRAKDDEPDKPAGRAK